MDEPYQVPPEEPEFGSLPGDWSPVPVEKLQLFWRWFEAKHRDRLENPDKPASPGIAVGGSAEDSNRGRAFSIRGALLIALADKGIEITDEVIAAMATRPISPTLDEEALIGELVAEFRTSKG
ncbi:MAG TPA: hypothetical protein VEG30_15045 [Terriglobales bacterium]|nr:hypothetical protein [Terriglobales bacterium]